MAKAYSEDLPAEMMRPAARLTCHHACRQLRAQFDHTGAAQPATEDNPSRFIQAHDTAAIFAQVDPQHRDLHCSLRSLSSPQVMRLDRGAGHPIRGYALP